MCYYDYKYSAAPPSAPSQIFSRPGKGMFQSPQGTSSPSVGKATTGLAVGDVCLGELWALEGPLAWSSLSLVLPVGSPYPSLTGWD